MNPAVGVATKYFCIFRKAEKNERENEFHGGGGPLSVLDVRDPAYWFSEMSSQLTYQEE
jgi:hypothetical protein